MDSLADWLRENELIINLKRGKTESLVFGTAQRIAKHNEPLKVSISRPLPTVITTTEVYKYMAVLVDSLVNLSSNFDSCYKRAAGRLRLMEILRIYSDLLRLNIIKTEYARRSFYYMGAKVYNERPLEIRKAESTNDFEKQLNEHFRNP
jgi:hypothetical protein